MHANRVILANEPRLLRKILWQAIENVSDIEVVGEVSDLAGLMPLIEQTDTQWVVVSLGPDGRVPEMVDKLLTRQPWLYILALSSDGSQTKVRWVAPHEESLDNVSLGELIELFHGGRPRERNFSDPSG